MKGSKGSIGERISFTFCRVVYAKVRVLWIRERSTVIGVDEEEGVGGGGWPKSASCIILEDLCGSLSKRIHHSAVSAACFQSTRPSSFGLRVLDHLSSPLLSLSLALCPTLASVSMRARLHSTRKRNTLSLSSLLRKAPRHHLLRLSLPVV